jgi:hypothetical protein
VTPPIGAARLCNESFSLQCIADRSSSICAAVGIVSVCSQRPLAAAGARPHPSISHLGRTFAAPQLASII